MGGALPAGVLQRTAELEPPNAYGRSIAVPIGQLYVEPVVSPPLTLRTFPDELTRSVVLGAPGAGKSTLARVVGRRLLMERGTRPPLTPFIVVLRNYSATRETHTIIERLSADLKRDFQDAPPSGALEYLIDTGRVVLILDGLDEIVARARRANIVKDIEALSSRYPATRMLVTSRVVGYEQAPLSNLWDAHEIRGFDEVRIRKYVENWLDAERHPDPETRPDRAERLIEALREIPDLASSPLMLALLCSFSNEGRRELPRDRPTVYQECADLLYRTWDKDRGIYYDFPFDKKVPSIMDHLAAWIYGAEILQAGVTRRQIERAATDYLFPERYSDRDQAVEMAAMFCEFATGRMWVFIETGENEDGVPVYQFAHRTFLEYFTARHYTRHAVTPQKLASDLVPHIAEGDRDVVAQIAFRRLDEEREGAAGTMLRVVMGAAAQQEDTQRKWNLESFAARSLAFLVPDPDAVREVTQAICRSLIERSHMLPDGETGPSRVSTLGELGKANSEARQLIAEQMGKVLDDFAADEHAGARDMFTLVAELPVLVTVGYRPASPPEPALRDWRSASVAAVAARAELATAMAPRHSLAAILAALHGQLAPSALLRAHPPRRFLSRRWIGMLTDVDRPPLADGLLLGPEAKAPLPVDWGRPRVVAAHNRILEAVADAWPAQDLPWASRAGGRDIGLSVWAASSLTAQGLRGAALLRLAGLEDRDEDRALLVRGMLDAWQTDETQLLAGAPREFELLWSAWTQGRVDVTGDQQRL